MNTLVVDASVAVKWMFDEVHSAQARGMLEHGSLLLAPDLILFEVDNSLCKRVRRGEITVSRANVLRRESRRVPLELFPSRSLLDVAYHVANSTGASVYDSLYLALSIVHTYPLVTADERFIASARAAGLGSYVRWVGDFS